MKINAIFNTRMFTTFILSCLLKDNFQKPLRQMFRFFFLSFESVHLHKNMKSNFNLSINVRLKVTRVFCILNSSVID